MKPSGRIDFIQTVKRALDRKDPTHRTLEDLISNEPDGEESQLLETIVSRNTDARLTLLERLVESAGPINASVIRVGDAAAAGDVVARIAGEKSVEWGEDKSIVAWDHPLVKALDRSARFRSLNIPVHFPDTGTETAGRRESFRGMAESAFIGITSADYCIAETASLAMKTRPGQPRCVSLLPSIHIAVIELEQILANLNEWYTLLRWDPDQRNEGLTRCMTLITGPSKTADIEATLVHGAHGPRELTIVVLTGHME